MKSGCDGELPSFGCFAGVLPPVLSQADWQPSLQSIQLSQRHWLSRKTETIPGKEGQTTAEPETLAGRQQPFLGSKARLQILGQTTVLPFMF